MRKLFSCIILLCFFSNTSGCTEQPSRSEVPEPAVPDSTSMNILFIGNSITYYNDMPTIFRNMANASGKNINVEKWVQGGVILGYFALNANAEQIINQKKWDYVILQDGDYHIIYPEDHPRLAGYVYTLRNLILKNNPNTKILFHLLHALKDGITHDNVYYDYTTFTQKIIEGTKAFARYANLTLAPVGIAWNYIVVNKPSINLYDSDGMHPSYAGSYLIASVYYSAIFKQSSVGNAYIGSLSSENARIIQTKASETVLNFNIN